MPLHDWTALRHWHRVHSPWVIYLNASIRPQLPAGYRCYIGTSSIVSVAPGRRYPDVGVSWPGNAPRPEGDAAVALADDGFEAEVAVPRIDPQPNVQVVDDDGNLVAVIEVVSPRNKDRPSERENSSARYSGYVVGGAHLMLIDVLPRPYGFSFADAIAAELEVARPPLPTPSALVVRVGGPASVGGNLVSFRAARLMPGEPLPPLPLPLLYPDRVLVDLDGTYSRAAADAYLD